MKRTRTHHPSQQRSERAPAPLPRSARGARAEREAESSAARLPRDAEAGAPPSRSVATRPLPGGLPRGVRGALRSGGRPLEPAAQRRMGSHFDHDFSRVRVHDDAAAARSNRGLAARAYTVGHHVVLGRGAPAAGTAAGDRLLAHELTHVVQQQRPGRSGGVQRIGLWEAITRFFGGGTFDENELRSYLLKLEEGGEGKEADGKAIEGDYDGDNKARAVVMAGLHKGTRLYIRRRLIMEMIDGATTGADEERILEILEDATALEREVLIEQIGVDLLEENIDGDNLKRLQALIGRSQKAGPQPITSDWLIQYRVRGAVEARPERVGLVVNNASVRPTGSEDAKTLLERPLVNDHRDGSAKLLKSGLEHPRNRGGTGHVAFALAGLDEQGVVVPPVGRTIAETATYPPLGFADGSRKVVADLDIQYEWQQTGETTGEQEKANEKQRETTDIQRKRDEREEGSSHKTGRTDTRERRDTTAQRREREQSKEKERGKHQEDERRKLEGSEEQKKKEKETSKSEESEKTTSKEKENEKSRTDHETVTLRGDVSTDIKGKYDIRGGIEVDGNDLIFLLARVPGGTLFKRFMKKLKLLPDLKMTLDVHTDGTYTLSTKVSREVAEGWSKTKRELERKGSSETKRKGKGERKLTGETDIKRREDETTKRSGTSETDREGTRDLSGDEQREEQMTGTSLSVEDLRSILNRHVVETGRDVRRADIDRTRSLTRTTEFQFRPVVKDHKLTFRVE